MFNTEQDYNNSIKHALVYTRTHSKSSSSKLFVFNIIALVFLGYMIYFSFIDTQSQFSLPSLKQGVLGVSETLNDSEMEKEKLKRILKDKEVTSLPNSMKVLSHQSSIQSKPTYIEDTATVLDDSDRSGFRGKIAVVKQEMN